MPKKGIVTLKDLNIEAGCSMTDGSMVLYTKEEKEFLKEVREYIKNSLTPKINEFYNHPTYEKGLNICREIPLKFLTAGIPLAYGEEPKPMTFAIWYEELNAASYSLASISARALGVAEILPFFSKAQYEQFVKPTLKLEKTCSSAITEPAGGSDAWGSMETFAKREGDSYVVNGEKIHVTGGSSSDYLLLFCKTIPNAPSREGVSVFIFPKDTPGFKKLKDFGMMGRAGTILSHIKFENCRIPKEYLIGEENKGSEILDHRLGFVRTTCVFRSVGVARAAFEIAAKYAGERIVFKSPLRRFEGISFKIADMYTRIECSRLLGIRAMRMIEKGMNATKEVASAKFYSSDMAPWVCDQALQILGAIGYTTEYPIERLYRDARAEPISEGTSEIMKFLCQREIFRDLGY